MALIKKCDVTGVEIPLDGGVEAQIYFRHTNKRPAKKHYTRVYRDLGVAKKDITNFISQSCDQFRTDSGASAGVVSLLRISNLDNGASWEQVIDVEGQTTYQLKGLKIEAGTVGWFYDGLCNLLKDNLNGHKTVPTTDRLSFYYDQDDFE